MVEDRLERLLDEYEARIATGNSVDASELCRDCPELLGPLQEKIKLLGRFEAAWCLTDGSTRNDDVARRQLELLPAESAYSTGSRFVLQEPLASGGLGDVYVARDLDIDRRVAIKFLKSDGRTSPELAARFLREARITGYLDHPGIAPVFAMGQDESQQPFYAMRLVGGTTLQSAIDELHRRVPTDRTWTTGMRRLLSHFVSVCNTVAFAHSRGIVHRDLKPLNIMLGDFGETVVVDWGLAKKIATNGVKSNDTKSSASSLPTISDSQDPGFQTTHGSVSGTWGFMSPEQAQGDIEALDERSDIFSLGGILFVILTGKTLLSGVKTAEAIGRMQRRELPRPSTLNPRCPRSLEAICLKATAFGPADRYGSAMDLACDIEHYLADEPVSARRESAIDWAGRMLRRHRQIALVSGAALLLTTVLMGVGLLLLRAEKNETASARDKALANLETAISAIDGLYTEISENDLLHEPGAEELRKKLLGKASIYYQRLQQTAQDSPQLELAAAQALFRVAEITSQIDSPNNAIAIYESAIEQLVELRALDNRPETQAALATAYNGLARTYFELQQFDSAGNYYAKSLVLLRETSGAKEEIPAAQSILLAGTLNSRGSNWLSQLKIKEAMSDYDEAAKILEGLQQVNPNDVRIWQTLAANQSNRAVANRMLNQTSEVVSLYEQSLNSYQQASTIDPGDDETLAGMAKTEFNLANFLSGTGEQELALARYKSASQVLVQLCRDFPLRVSYRILFAKTLLNQGIAQARFGELEAAESTFGEAINRYQAICSQYPALVEIAVDHAQAHQNIGHVLAGDHYELDPKRARDSYDRSISIAEKTLQQAPPASVKNRLTEIVKYSKQYRDQCEMAIQK